MQRDEVEENVKVVYYRMFITATKFQAHVRCRIHDLPTDVTHCLTKSNTREGRHMWQRAWQQRHRQHLSHVEVQDTETRVRWHSGPQPVLLYHLRSISVGHPLS